MISGIEGRRPGDLSEAFRPVQRRRFSDPSEQEVLAPAISAEAEDARACRSCADRVRKDAHGFATAVAGKAVEDDGHRRRLTDLHLSRFGDVIPLTDDRGRMTAALGPCKACCTRGRRYL